MSEPRRTLNGQVLLDKAIASRTQEVTITAQALVYVIAAIEAEARAAFAARIIAAVERLPRWDKRTVPGGFHVNRAAVLDAIRAMDDGMDRA